MSDPVDSAEFLAEMFPAIDPALIGQVSAQAGSLHAAISALLELHSQAQPPASAGPEPVRAGLHRMLGQLERPGCDTPGREADGAAANLARLLRSDQPTPPAAEADEEQPGALRWMEVSWPTGVALRGSADAQDVIGRGPERGELLEGKLTACRQFLVTDEGFVPVAHPETGEPLLVPADRHARWEFRWTRPDGQPEWSPMGLRASLQLEKAYQQGQEEQLELKPDLASAGGWADLRQMQMKMWGADAVCILRRRVAVVSPAAVTSCLEWALRLSPEYKNGWLWKWAGGFNHSGDPGYSWNRRWFSLRSNFLAYYRLPTDPQPRGIVFFDKSTRVGFDGRLKLQVQSDYRTLLITAEDVELASRWHEAISCVADPRRDLCRACRYGSFAPVRPGERAKWFVDGAATFAAISKVLFAAKHEILITGWMLLPEVLLELHSPFWHGPAGGPSRKVALMDVLKEKAAQGVVVKVLLYRPLENYFATGADHAEEMLSRIRVQVVRHSESSVLEGLWSEGNAWWSHHEKLVVVDQDVAFVGGLDLAIGRWDTPAHNLWGGQELWPGKDFYNPRISDFTTGFTQSLDKDWFDRTKGARMPWHDVHMAVTGAAARDVAQHFAERWNREARATDRLVSSGDPRTGALDWCLPIPEQEPQSVREALNDWDLVDCQLTRSVGSWSNECSTETSIEQAYIDAIQKSEHYIYIEQQFFITGHAGPPVSNRVGQALFEKVASMIETNKSIHAEARSLREMANELEAISAAAKDAAGLELSPCDVGQLQRQATESRANADKLESSIKASRKKFRLIIVVPMWPSGSDPAASADVRNLIHWQRLSLFHGAHSLVGRLAAAYPEEDIAEYIHIFNLKKWQCDAEGSPAVEQIYVHSKLMIVDDRICIIGSANLNDRSLLGDRDSEVAVVCEPPHSTDEDPASDGNLCEGMVDIRLAGQSYSASVFAHTLRVQLWAEHLGLLSDADTEHPTVSLAVAQQLQDPIQSFDTSWVPVAARNTLAFDLVFPHLPSDQQPTWEQVPSRVPASKESIAFLQEVQGVVVRMPTRFLADEELYSKRFIVPDETFT